MWWTLTDVTALGVNAVSVLASLRVLALVDIRTVATGLVQRESLVADAAEHAVNVFAFAENAEIAEHLTLVDIYSKTIKSFYLFLAGRKTKMELRN
jgi:hypothetical protein